MRHNRYLCTHAKSTIIYHNTCALPKLWAMGHIDHPASHELVLLLFRFFFSIFTLIKNILILWPKPNPNGSRHYRILINTTWGCLNTNMTLLLWIRSMSQGQIFWYEIKGFAKRNPYTKYESLTLIKTILLCNPLLF